MNKETVDAIVKTVDVVEDQLETIERIPNVNLNGTTKKQQILIFGVTATIAAVAGYGLSYFVTKKYLKAKYVEIAEKEIGEAKIFYSQLNKTGDFSDPTKLADPYKQRLKDMGYTHHDIEVEAPVATEEELMTVPTAHPALTPVIDDGSQEAADLIAEGEALIEVIDEPIEKNVFKDARSANSYFDYDEEMKHRRIDTPYIISYDEFYQGEKDYSQNTLTYFEGDDVLVDDKDSPINETNSVVGDDNLVHFGHGSKDNNVVYVRNDLLEVDFEILRSTGDYTKEVLGFIEHSERRGKTRKFRRDDE